MKNSALDILTENAVHVLSARKMNIQMPKHIQNSRVLYIETDYSSKLLLESSKNVQRFV